MSNYILDDVLELTDGDMFVAMNMSDGGEIIGPPVYVRVPLETLREYELFQSKLMREVGIPFHHPPVDEHEGETRRRVWQDYIDNHIDHAGTSQTAWQTLLTVGA